MDTRKSQSRGDSRRSRNTTGRWLIVPILFGLVLSLPACGTESPVDPSLPLFSLRCEPGGLTVTNAAVRSVCTVTGGKRLSGEMQFRCMSQGQAIPCRFDPPSVPVVDSYSAYTFLFVDLALGAKPGPYTVQVSATGGDFTATFDVGVNLAYPCAGFVEQPPYTGDCRARPANTTCWRFPDGYLWWVNDGVGGADFSYQCGDRRVTVTRGSRADYHHVENTLYVRTGPSTR